MKGVANPFSIAAKKETRSRAGFWERIRVDKKRGSAQTILGLVAQTLLMAILFHALLALVLIDFRFTAFLDGTHGGIVSVVKKVV